ETREKLPQLAAKRFQPGIARKRLIETKRGEHHVDFFVRQMLLEIRKVRRSWCQPNFVRRPGEITHHQLVLGKALMQQRLHLAIKLSSLEQRVADERDSLARLQVQRQRRLNRRRSHCPWRRLRENAVLGKFRIPRLQRLPRR